MPKFNPPDLNHDRPRNIPQRQRVTVPNSKGGSGTLNQRPIRHRKGGK